ncbi:hypothetical protein OWR29_40375 [Actinoplanes sp. Pm04-4]|uniref:PH domain-containing protein n=1 Tax=Paractinoplanes pyxinae TaxID=2997416 RepID=A0ABT4BCP3_9ACTN|nr:hypothetical protein [Actinoplanes pyxinae]MCY1144288.1 hypothetical protein [Actinoplanes pyxinae]
MGTSEQPVGDVQVLGRSRIWPAVAIPGVAAAALIVVAVALRYVPWYPLIVVGASLVVAVTRRGSAVLADDVGLLIRERRGTSRSYAWADIERMGWLPNSIGGAVLQVYPRGGPYDVPGPNSAAGVARIWGPGRRRLEQPLAELRRRHGIKTLLDG